MKKFIALIMILAVLCCNALNVIAAQPSELEVVVNDAAKYMHETVKSPQVGVMGGEWAVLGIARSQYKVPDEYYLKYYQEVEKYVRACNGVLHDRKYTEYSRVIVALTAIGKNPSNVGGYNLLMPLGDYDKTIWQGMNGPVWALIALDSGNYEIPINVKAKTQATRELYIQRILDCQLADGGWSLLGGMIAIEKDEETRPKDISYEVSDADITGMVLQALAKYQDRADVRKAIQKALVWVSKIQSSDGGFGSWGQATSESSVQMLVALCELKIPIDDKCFVKNGHTILDNILSYYVKGKGFMHTKDSNSINQLATEQGLYGIVAAKRALDGKNSLYRMSDAISIHDSISIDDTETNTTGLPGKHADVNTPKVSKVGKTFSDIQPHKNRQAIEALAQRDIISGKSATSFAPNDTMTRAEFAAIIVKALGLSPKVNNTFSDVNKSSWYAGYVGTANEYGFVSGTSSNTFSPNGTITREQAATMISNAAKLCGMDVDYSSTSTRDVLSQFLDYVKCSSWAQKPLAFCYDNEILDSSELEIMPNTKIKRCEVAQMIYNLIGKAKLL